MAYHLTNTGIAMKMLLYLFLSMTLFSSCQKGVVQEAINNNGGAVEAKTMNNVAYGTDTAQRMDIYLPANRSKDSTKVIVLIHGGAWMEGDKRDFDSYMAVFKQKLPGYAIVNMNYRLASQLYNHFPAQENDVKSVVNFLFDKGDEYKISDKFVLLGASAGGHLALLHAYKYTAPVKIKAVVSLFGPTNLEDMYNSQTNAFYQYGMSLLIGGTPATNPAAFQQSSPIHFAGAQSPPTIMLHGGRDQLVNINQSISLKAKLDAAGVINQLVTYPNEGHGWYGSKMDDSFNKIEAFIKANVR
jgi:acetyl esterase/lipase